jgi:chromosome segregation ATPase
MHVETSFWKRVGNMFRSSDDEPTNGNGHGNGHTATEPEPAQADDEARGSTGSWSLTRREPSAREIRDNYRRVGELMNTLQEHFERQDQRSEQVADSVKNVAQSLSQLSEYQKTQNDYIRSIAARVEGVDEHASRLSETISKLPEALSAQAQSVQALGRQVELFQEADQRVANSLVGLSQSVDSLRTSAVAQVETLRQLGEGENEKRQALTTLIKEQSRRFIVVLVITAVLGIAALTGMGATLAMVLNRGA